MTHGTARAASAVALLLLALPAQAQTKPRWAPEAGSHRYRYESIERGGGADKGYQVDYDLVSDGKGGIVAVVKRAAHGIAGKWMDATLDDACRTALHAGPRELARITLSPLAPDAAGTLGDAFMAPCAPADLFFPMTDILNVALIQATPHFRIDRLATPGDSARFEGFKTSLDRFGIAIDASSGGGTIRFATLEPGRASVDWAPDPMAITILNRKAFNGVDLKLDGTEDFSFRVTIDPATGVLLGAGTTHDRLSLVANIPGVPPRPLSITREVTISRR